MNGPGVPTAIQEPARRISIAGRYDVLICGGGSAGLAAALAASRSGASTLLVELNGFLGGVATAALVSEFGGQAGYDYMSGVAKEMADRLIARGQATPGRFRTSFESEAFKHAALEMLQQAGAHLLLYTLIADAIVIDRCIRGVIVENKSGRQALLSKVVVDATGDADVAACAGASVVRGREGDGRMRPVSLFFRVGNIDVEQLLRFIRENPQQFAPDPSKNIMDLDRNPPMVRPMGFFDLVRQAKEKDDYPEECHYLRIDNLNLGQRMATINTTRVYDVDGTRAEDLTQAYLKGVEQMRRVLAFLNAYVPGFSHSYLLDTAPVLGVRETRRIVGEYVLSEADIVEARSFPDVIGVPGYRHTRGGAVHSPDGQEGAESDVVNREAIDELFVYGIPYRCLLPVGVEGLLVAGRCISATHAADGYTRVIPSCMLTGQAAGTAAALAAQADIFPRQVDVSRLQRSLAGQGVRLVAPVAMSQRLPRT
jgi:FAD dependent oxidoreductase